jgi:RNA polymerase sigma factor (sigma-70 family)
LSEKVKPNNIEAIWNQVLSGDVAAWQLLVDLYAGLILAVARKIGLSELDAEDCAQNTWLALYRRRNAIKDPKAIPAWLIKTTHRGAIELARRTRHISIGFEPEQTQPELPDEVVMQLEREFLIRKAMERLDARCRILIEKLYLNGERPSYGQLAKQLSIASNSLGPLRTRCLDKLAKILKEMGVSLD